MSIKPDISCIIFISILLLLMFYLGLAEDI